MAVKTLGYFTNNEFVQSTTDKFYPVFNPSTGEQIAQMPRCTTAEVSKVIDNAHEAYKKWSRVPVIKRVQILYKVRDLLIEHMDELTRLCATEIGKRAKEIFSKQRKARNLLAQCLRFCRAKVLWTRLRVMIPCFTESLWEFL